MTSRNCQNKVLRWVTLLGVTATLLLLTTPRANAQARRGAELAVPAVRSQMLVSTEWLARHLQDPDVAVLHVARQRANYDAGHIPGARFLALSDIAVTVNGVPNELPPAADLQKVFQQLGVGDKERVVLYGELSGLLAARAYFTLDYLGQGERAALLDGGLEKWQAEKRSLSTTPPTFQAAQFTPRIRPEALVTLPLMRDLSWEAANVAKPGVALIDARPGEDYTGEKAGEGVARAGHIPGAASLYWMQTIESKEDPSLRPPVELRKLYQAAGAATGRKIVTYCRSGIQSSHAYFTAKYLGYDVAMYDGSFVEWSNTTDLPVEKGTK